MPAELSMYHESDRLRRWSAERARQFQECCRAAFVVVFLRLLAAQRTCWKMERVGVRRGMITGSTRAKVWNAERAWQFQVFCRVLSPSASGPASSSSPAHEFTGPNAVKWQSPRGLCLGGRSCDCDRSCVLTRGVHWEKQRKTSLDNVVAQERVQQLTVQRSAKCRFHKLWNIGPRRRFLRRCVNKWWRSPLRRLEKM